jgi:hypothetical protein
MKLLRDETYSDDVERWIEDPAVDAISSSLLETELRRAAAWWEIDQERATETLGNFSLYEHPEWEFRAAGLIPGRFLRSLDAIHVAAALRAQADVLISYDARMIAAASAMGLPVVQPGVDDDASVAPAGIG